MEQKENISIKLINEVENSEELIANMEYNIIISGQDGNNILLMINYKYRSWKSNIIKLYTKTFYKN